MATPIFFKIPKKSRANCMDQKESEGVQPMHHVAKHGHIAASVAAQEDPQIASLASHKNLIPQHLSLISI